MAKSVKNAILLAAGLGTRLRPITDDIPKCLVPINGKPLLEIWLEQLFKFGVEHFWVNTHYLSEQVQRVINNHALREHVTLFHEPELLGTAGTVKAIINEGFVVEGDTLVLHADNVCQCNWDAFFSYHLARSKDTIATLLAFQCTDPSSCGILEIDSRNRLLNFFEKVENPPGNLANGAVYLFSSEAMSLFSDLSHEETDISYHLVPKLLGRAHVWQIDGYLQDIGNKKAYYEALDKIALSPFS